MAETRQLVAGFESGTPPAVRWHALATRKLVEIDAEVARAARMRQFLKRALACGCLRLADCGTLLDTSAPRSPKVTRTTRRRRSVAPKGSR